MHRDTLQCWLPFGRPLARDPRYQPSLEALEQRLAPANLLPGFSETLVNSGGALASPTTMEFAPDGRLFVAEKGGTLRIIVNGTPQSALTLTVDSAGERGLLGIAFDPNFATNQFIYLYYTATTPTIHNRVSRFTMNGNTVMAGSELPILELPTLGATNHNGGAIHFGPDGKLYVAVGENAVPANSQTLSNLLGKVLRINSDGSFPSDNPFFDSMNPTAPRSAIYALGLRNPFNFAFQPGTTRVLVNDVGQSAFEEINDLIAGSNYGWSNSEGFRKLGDTPTTIGTYRDPIAVYDHTVGPTGGAAIVGASFYNPATVQFPSVYVGKYFFSDLVSRWIHVLNPDTGAVSSFANDLPSSPVDVKVASDGSLYYLSLGTGAVYQVQFTSAPPSAGELPGVFRNGTWFLQDAQGDYDPLATNQFSFGAAGDLQVVGDWLGDGEQRVGVFRNGTWFLSTTNSAYSAANTIQISYGMAGDIPVVGKWVVGDAHDHIGYFRPSTGTWFLDTEVRTAGTNDTSFDPATTIQVNFGAAGDVPVVGEWLGDGITRIGVFRSGTWFLDKDTTRVVGTPGTYAATTTIQISYGSAGDAPVVGKWLGDGFDRVGVFRRGTWFLDEDPGRIAANGPTAYSAATTSQVSYGAAGDVPVVGAWLGDAFEHIGVFRNGTWFLDKDTTRTTQPLSSYAAATTTTEQFGAAGDRPKSGFWFGAPQLLDGDASGGSSASLRSEQLAPIVAEALRRWAATGLSTEQIARLRSVAFVVTDLTPGWLGEFLPGTVFIDANASGFGWFVDPTPRLDEEFAGASALAGSAAAGRVDLLTVVTHEMGHALGLGDGSGKGTAADLMAESLAPGIAVRSWTRRFDEPGALT
ncbi:MAG: PQQ-dependent sugar dehydrogenase [Gemmataceae bacterium]|nr:PQQ-dependent sugar dehydrogenase [Gemmataceae bacterium]